jgi:hypothetical protein
MTEIQSARERTNMVVTRNNPNCQVDESSPMGCCLIRNR